MTSDPIVPIQDYYYLDRMSDLPHHDEQGTRERPYFLTLAFDPARIDALLAALGERPWLTRPRLQIRLSIRDASGVTYPLTADGDDDERHRQGLAAAARKFGMRLALRSEKAAADPKLSDALLIEGEIIWSDADFGWVGKWRAGDTTWGIKGVSFDAAYRNLVLGAMAIASGHQLPVQAAQ